MSQEDIESRIAERIHALGRPLTPQELIEVINKPPGEEQVELTYELDEDQ